MNSKWLAALAVLFLVASACICNGEILDATSDLGDASARVIDAAESALKNDIEQTPIDEELIEQEQLDDFETEPDVYTCDYINHQRKNMTELQWEEYTKSLIGKPVEYTGEITQVYDDASIQIRACSGIFSGGVFVVYGTPKDVAIEFSKGQFVQGEGTIREVGTFILMYIHVNGEIIE